MRLSRSAPFYLASAAALPLFFFVACSTATPGVTATDAGVDATMPDAAPALDSGVTADAADAGPTGCGAGFASKCDVGEACTKDVDCKLANCIGGVCKSASCTDGKRDGDEVGVDCGGTCSSKCDGDVCAADADCKSKACRAGVCAPRGTKSCGVGVAATCANGELCEQDKDCTSVYCAGNLCAAPDAVSHQDGRINAGETGIDCGGSIKATNLCPGGQACIDGSDCQGLCAANVCAAPTHTDGKKNLGESDVDCGGAVLDAAGKAAPICGTGKTCVRGADCESQFCGAAGTCEPRKPGRKDGDETDVDCGGTKDPDTNIVPPRCDDAKSCLTDGDCKGSSCSQASRVCVAGRSCRTGYAGVETCGKREDGDVGVAHDSCCTSLPLPTIATTRLDKYEITAGRMRQFVTALAGTVDAQGAPYGANVKKWASDQIAANTSVGQNLSAQIPANLLALLPTTDDPNTPLNLFVQLGGTTMDARWPSSYQGCAMARGAAGHATYWADPAQLAFYGYPARVVAKDALDAKSLNCTPYWMFAAFCAWDGGKVASMNEVWDAYSTDAYPWGPSGLNGAGAPVSGDQTSLNVPFDYERSVGYYTVGYRHYQFPGVPTVDDISPQIAAPGRFLADASRLKGNGQSWMDLGANLIEYTSTVYQQNRANFCDYSLGDDGNPANAPCRNFTPPGGNQPVNGTLRDAGTIPGMWLFSASWEGHGFTRGGWNLSAHTQYGKIGARCSRPKL